MRLWAAVLTCFLAGCGANTAGSNSTSGSASGTSGTSGSTSGSTGSTGSSSGSSGSTGGSCTTPGNTAEGPSGFGVCAGQEIDYGDIQADAGLVYGDGGTAVTFERSAILFSAPGDTVCAGDHFSPPSVQVQAYQIGGPVVPGVYPAEVLGGSATQSGALVVDVSPADGGPPTLLTLSGAANNAVTVTVTRADAQGFAGTYQGSTFADGGGELSIHGTFDVVTCP